MRMNGEAKIHALELKRIAGNGTSGLYNHHSMDIKKKNIGCLL